MKAEKKNDPKTILLLQPQRLPLRKPVVQMLKVERRGTLVNLEELPINPANMATHLRHADKNLRSYLTLLSDKELEIAKSEINKKLALLSVEEKEAERQGYRMMTRHYHAVFSNLRHYQGQIGWYHRVTQPGTLRVSTAPCMYQPFTAQLEFEALRTDAGPDIQVWVKYGRERHLLTSFRRFCFLLEREGAYYLLGLSATEALDWLEEQDLTIFAGGSMDDFIEKIVVPISRLQQMVNTDGLLQKEKLQVTPVNKVRLSELNNTFLMLTPQFVYDGYELEGPWMAETEVRTPDGPLLVVRDRTAEEAFSNYLRQLHPNFARQHNGYFYLSFADAQKKHWFLKAYHQLLEMDVVLTGMDMLRHFRYAPFKASTDFEVVEEQDGWLVASFTVSFGKDKVALPDLQKMLLAGQKAVMLQDGSLGVLGEEWLQQYAPLIKHGKIHGKKLWIPRWLAFSSEETDSGLTMRKTIRLDWLERWRQWQNGGQALYALPEMVAGISLRPYQQKGFDWLALLAEAGGSACLADDMGLGKTLQTICFLAHKLQQHPGGRHLVVCPASLMYNWQQEFEKFAPTIATYIHHGAQRNVDCLDDADTRVWITSYGTLRQDIAYLAPVMWDTVVVDESHHIKNPATQVSRAVQQLQSVSRVALSGTPVMNGTEDLYAQINFLLPGLLGSREFFRCEYAIPIEQQRDEEKARALQKILAPFILRRTKEQVAPDLPDKTETILWCTMGQDQRMAYETIRENIRNSVLLDIEQHGLNKGKMSVLAGLTKLRQLCNSGELVRDQDIFCYDSIKSEVLMEELKNIIPKHKALVFSQFTAMLDLLERDLRKAGIPYLRLDGSTRAVARQELVNTFQDGEDDNPVFLLSLKAGNAGLNLTAADYVFLFDPWWNAAVEHQAIDRTHRIGQHKQVFAYRMICKGTVEEKIIRMQQRKKKLAEDLITTDESFLKELTLEDVQYLLG